MIIITSVWTPYKSLLEENIQRFIDASSQNLSGLFLDVFIYLFIVLPHEVDTCKVTRNFLCSSVLCLAVRVHQEPALTMSTGFVSETCDPDIENYSNKVLAPTGHSSLQFTHQWLHGGEETSVKLLVGESLHRAPGVSSDLQSSWWRQSQDGFHGSGVAVLAVSQETRLSALVRHHDVQLWTARFVGENYGACSHTLHHTCR